MRGPKLFSFVERAMNIWIMYANATKITSKLLISRFAVLFHIELSSKAQESTNTTVERILKKFTILIAFPYELPKSCRSFKFSGSVNLKRPQKFSFLTYGNKTWKIFIVHTLTFFHTLSQHDFRRKSVHDKIMKSESFFSIPSKTWKVSHVTQKNLNLLLFCYRVLSN